MNNAKQLIPNIVVEWMQLEFIVSIHTKTVSVDSVSNCWYERQRIRTNKCLLTIFKRNEIEQSLVTEQKLLMVNK